MNDKTEHLFENLIVSFFSGLEFEWNANLRLAEFRQTMKQSWLILLSILRTLLFASGLEGDIRFQSIEVNGKTFLQRYSPAPSAFNACACSVARSCPDSVWSGAQFLCYYGDNCTAGSTVWSIPGFIKSCTAFDSIFGSDLRCFFSRTCIDTLLSMYNVDMPKREPLPSATLNIEVLNSSALLSFSPNDTMENMLDELMIDDWKMRTNYVGYYNSCAPARCTYTITRRTNLLYAVTLITTFFGGLAISFRLFVPICVRFVHWIWIHRHHYYSNTNDQRSTRSSCGISIFVERAETEMTDIQNFLVSKIKCKKSFQKDILQATKFCRLYLLGGVVIR